MRKTDFAFFAIIIKPFLKACCFIFIRVKRQFVLILDAAGGGHLPLTRPPPGIHQWSCACPRRCRRRPADAGQRTPLTWSSPDRAPSEPAATASTWTSTPVVTSMTAYGLEMFTDHRRLVNPPPPHTHFIYEYKPLPRVKVTRAKGRFGGLFQQLQFFRLP